MVLLGPEEFTILYLPPSLPPCPYKIWQLEYQTQVAELADSSSPLLSDSAQDYHASIIWASLVREISSKLSLMDGGGSVCSPVPIILNHNCPCIFLSPQYSFLMILSLGLLSVGELEGNIFLPLFCLTISEDYLSPLSRLVDPVWTTSNYISDSVLYVHLSSETIFPGVIHLS